MIRLVVEATDRRGPRGDFALRSGGGGTRWEGRPCEIEDAEIDLDDWNGGEFAREEIAAWVIVAGALKGGCKEGTMEGVMKTIFDEGCVRS